MNQMKSSELTAVSYHLEQVILHDVANDSKLVEVAPASFCSKRLFERYQNTGDAFTIPRRSE